MSQSVLFLSTSLPGVSDERYRYGALPMVARLIYGQFRVWPWAALSTNTFLYAVKRLKKLKTTSVCRMQYISPAVTLVSWSKTLNHCFVLRMGRKAVGKRSQCTYRKEKGFALVFLAVAALCAIAPCKPFELNNWVSEFITAITYLSESLYILSALSTLFGRYVR